MNFKISPDSKVFAAVSRAADLAILNLLFLLTSIPVITIGASYTALYKSVFAIGTKRESGTVRSYFRAFKANLKQSTMLWLLLLFAGAMLAADYFLFEKIPGGLGGIRFLFALLGAVAVFIACYAFPLTALFDNTLMGTLKNALFISIGNFPRSVVIAVLQVFPFFLVLRYPMYFFTTGFIWLAVYFSAAAYISSLLMRRAFAPFLPDDYFKPEEDEKE